MCFFIRFFIFADPPPDNRDYQSHVRQRRQAKLLPEKDATPSIILEKTYYDIDQHSPESLDWLTILLSQGIKYARTMAAEDDWLLQELTRLLNSDKMPSFVSEIKVVELNTGKNFPVFSNCKIVKKSGLEKTVPDNMNVGASASSPGSGLGTPLLRTARSQELPNPKIEEEVLEAQINVDLKDDITLGIDTNLLINFPRPNFCYLPINLAISIVKFVGVLKISLRPANENQGAEEDHDTSSSQSQAEKSCINISFAPDYQMDFKITSSIGSTSKLTNVPKIAQLVQHRLKKAFEERFVYPNEKQVFLPSVFPKKKVYLSESVATSPRLHPRTFSSVSQLASNTVLNMPSHRSYDDESAII